MIVFSHDTRILKCTSGDECNIVSPDARASRNYFYDYKQNIGRHITSIYIGSAGVYGGSGTNGAGAFTNCNLAIADDIDININDSSEET